MGVTLKLATSLDGRIATSTGESRWITGEAARAAGHRLRAEHGAVGIGIGTALADDPELTVRLPGYDGPQPARVVLDSLGRLPPSIRLARTADQVPTYVVTLTAAIELDGVRHIEAAAGPDGRPALRPVLEALKAAGISTLLVEGGGQVAASFVRAGLVDRIEWFRAPMLLGSEGRPCLGALEIGRLAEAPRFRRASVEALGSDLWERYERA